MKVKLAWLKKPFQDLPLQILMGLVPGLCMIYMRLNNDNTILKYLSNSLNPNKIKIMYIYIYIYIYILYNGL